jgi:hypothetical protein
MKFFIGVLSKVQTTKPLRALRKENRLAEKAQNVEEFVPVIVATTIKAQNVPGPVWDSASI